MSDLSRFDRWVEQAATEPVSHVDVTAAVQARIAAQPVIAGPTTSFAMACCAAATLAVLVAWPAVSALNDPVVGWLVGLQAGWLL